ncbi:MAG: sialidase family protein [Pseudonocardiaceae bacterium]
MKDFAPGCRCDQSSSRPPPSKDLILNIERRFGTALTVALTGAIIASWTVRANAASVVTVATGNLGVQQYHPPAGAPGENTAEEPSIGSDHSTDTNMYLSGLHTFAVTFDDTVQPAADHWKDVSFATTSQQSLDPILYTDTNFSRTFVSQLTGAESLTAFTDNDGTTWTPSQGGGIPSGVDHQSIGAGPYNPAGIPPQSTVFGDAVFYCSQDVATAFCARSDDGGLTFATGNPVYTFDQCGGLHGHIRLTPGGLDMLPNQNCDKQIDPGAGAQQAANGGHFPYQAVVTSNDNGTSWVVQTIPDSHATLRSDPAIAADKAGNLYFAYEDGVTAAGGTTQTGGLAKVAMGTIGSGGVITWAPSVDIGGVLGIQNVQFPEIIAGDPGRAALAFLGSTTAGNPEDVSFRGRWDLYLAITTDGGQNWTVTDTTPTNPVQRGCMYLAGNGSCPSSKRNLLDFMDITVDEDGHAIVGYADGCVGTCATGDGSACTSDVSGFPQVCNTGPAASTAMYASIARVQCGPSLYAEYDNRYACPIAGGQLAEVPWVPGMMLVAGAMLGAPVVGRRRRRARLAGRELV